MIILFRSAQLRRRCNDDRELKRHYDSVARTIRNRLDDLAAANLLSDIATLPHHRCHELEADRKGQLSIDLRHPYRLILEPADDPPFRKADGGIDWKAVRTIRILEIIDYH